MASVTLAQVMRGWLLLQRPALQHAVRAAIAAGLAWQIATLLPPLLSDYAFYAPLGAIIALQPTIADSASAAWRTLLAILMGFALAYAVYELTLDVPDALTIALIVALAIGVEQWRRLLREQANWVSFAAVLMLTVGAGSPGPYVLRYAGLTALGAAVAVLVTTVLFPPLQLTRALEQITRTRTAVAGLLTGIAEILREGRSPDPEEWSGRALSGELDRMRDAERLVERSRRANPRARRWQGRAAEIRAESRAVDRVAVLVDDLRSLVVEFQPHRRGIDSVDAGTGWVLADALDGLAGVLQTPYHATAGDIRDERDERIETAVAALDRLTQLLRSSTVEDDEGFFALGAVAVGVRRGLLALDAAARRAPH